MACSPHYSVHMTCQGIWDQVYFFLKANKTLHGPAILSTSSTPVSPHPQLHVTLQSICTTHIITYAPAASCLPESCPFPLECPMLWFSFKSLLFHLPPPEAAPNSSLVTFLILSSLRRTMHLCADRALPCTTITWTNPSMWGCLLHVCVPHGLWAPEEPQPSCNPVPTTWPAP